MAENQTSRKRAPALADSWQTAETLRLRIAETAPDADIRRISIQPERIVVTVGPVDVPTDLDLRPQLREVATAIDIAAQWKPTTETWRYLFRWECWFEGVRVVVQGEGWDEPFQRPVPAPMPEQRGVAA